MHINRSLLNWGVFLIALGGIPLAVDQEWLEPSIASDLSQLWPLILVGIGLGLILRWTPLSWFGGALVAATLGVIFGAALASVRDDGFANIQGIIPSIASGACASGEMDTASTSEGGPAADDRFALAAELSCGELNVSRAADASWSLEAAHDPDDAPRVDRSESDGVTSGVRLSQDANDDFVFLGSQVQSDWDISVPAGAAFEMNTTLNAAKADIDAGSGPLSRLAGTFNASDALVDLSMATTPQPATIDVTLNASDGELLLPDGTVNGDLTLNASSLVVCVPQSAALIVDYSGVLGGDDLSDSGLSEISTGRWASDGAAAATERVDLSVSSTVSSFSLERPEACS
jgi:hypothetical protein